MNLFPWTVFLPENFENGITQRFLTGDYMALGSISLFAAFLEKENSLQSLIVIFENISPKGFFWLNMKFAVLTANSRYLQRAALKYFSFPKSWILDLGCFQHYSFPGYGIQDFGWLWIWMPDYGCRVFFPRILIMLMYFLCFRDIVVMQLVTKFRA